MIFIVVIVILQCPDIDTKHFIIALLKLKSAFIANIFNNK